MKKLFAYTVMLLALVAAAQCARGESEAAKERREAWKKRKEFLKDRGILELETMVMTGDPSKRLDVVILSDGYNRQMLNKSYRSKSDTIAKRLVNLQPFENFRNYINFHRLFIESPDGEPVLGSTVNEARILTCDRAKVEEMAQYAPDCDLMLVISTTGRSARSTAQGNLITLSSKASLTRTTIHELGHAFGDLADEYVEYTYRFRNAPARQPPIDEPEEVNVTLESEPLLSKWHYWVVPPPRRAKIRNYEGALYVKKDVYRPCSNCMMREGSSFCIVCNEKMIRTFFEKIHPIDEQTPETVNVAVCGDEKMEFTAKALAYKVSDGAARARVNWRWYLDNEPVQPERSKSKASRYELDPVTVEPGIHEIVVSCDIIDQRVRRDYGMMSDARFWRVEVLPYPRPKLKAPEKITVRVGEEITLQVEGENLEAGQFAMRADGLPEHATFDPDIGDFAWTPQEDQAGAYLIDFVAANDKIEERVQTFIIVGKSAGKANKPPVFVDAVDENGFEGRPFNFTATAADPDGDALVFDANGLPKAAKFDRRTGKLTWSPGYMDAAEYYVTLNVTDGFKSAGAKIILIVLNAHLKSDAISGLFENTRGMGFDFCIPLRAEDSDFRLKAFEHLANTPIAFRAAHTARLLRDQRRSIWKEALEVAEANMEKRKFTTCFLRETADKGWQFTDNRDVLALLTEIVVNSKRETGWTTMLRKAISMLDTEMQKAMKYNEHRDAYREKVKEQRAKEEAEEEE
ncbi:MAG: hypothetical protein HQ592_02780 [Planctomycetes bacterium]|nr:hypothetical protein [Planctomycetota bacterium]